MIRGTTRVTVKYFLHQISSMLNTLEQTVTTHLTTLATVTASLVVLLTTTVQLITLVAPTVVTVAVGSDQSVERELYVGTS